jgi:hypothetical protein
MRQAAAMVLALTIGCGGTPFAGSSVDVATDAGDPPDGSTTPEASVDAGSEPDASAEASPLDGSALDAADAPWDALGPEAESGPQVCTWAGPPGGTVGCWPTEVLFPSELVTYDCVDRGAPSFASPAACYALDAGGCEADAGPCSQVECVAPDGACSVLSLGVVTCISGTSRFGAASQDRRCRAARAAGMGPPRVSARIDRGRCPRTF